MVEKKTKKENKQEEPVEKEIEEKQEDKKTDSKKKTKKVTEKEFEKKVVELGKKGLTSEKIGEELRKQDIHSDGFKKKISKILKENNLYENPDLKNLENKLERIKKHFEKNKQDKRAMREKDKIFSRIRKLKKYHKIKIK